MEWTIQDLGAAGELISALAVVVTLLFLTVQVRQATRATSENSRLLRAGMIRNADDSIAEWAGNLVSDPEVTRICSPLGMTAVDRKPTVTSR